MLSVSRFLSSPCTRIEYKIYFSCTLLTDPLPSAFYDHNFIPFIRIPGLTAIKHSSSISPLEYPFILMRFLLLQCERNESSSRSILVGGIVVKVD